MTGLSIANYGNSYATSTARNTLTVKRLDGSIVQPSKTSIRDAYTPNTAVNTFTVSNTYSAPATRKFDPYEYHPTPFQQWLDRGTGIIGGVGHNLAGFEEGRQMREWALGTLSSLSGLVGIDYARKNAEQIGVHSDEIYQPYFQNTLPATLRSDKIVIQSRKEATEQIINTQIDNALRLSGISLDEKARLNFNIDQRGKISITGDISDPDGRKQILEDILNGDDALRSNLYLYQVQKYRIEDKLSCPLDFSRESIMIALAYDWANGNITGVQEWKTWNDGMTWRNPDTDQDEPYPLPWGFPLEFSYQDGKIFQEKDFPDDRVFSNRLDSLDSLGKIIGLDESAAKDVQSFVSALEQNIAVDSSRLTGLLNAALDKAKLGDVKKKITFSQDAEGSIVIEGNIRDNQKKRLAEIINSDSELSELIKTQSAKKAVLTELKESITDEPALDMTFCGWGKHNARPAGFNLSQNSLVSAREQLLKNFLDRSGISMSDLEADANAVFEKHGELGEIKGLRNDITHLLTAKAKAAETKTTEFDATETQPLLAMKRGELVETVGVNERLGVDEAVVELKQRFNCIIKDYNFITEYNRLQANGEKGSPEFEIIGYTITFDQDGRMDLEVKTADGDPKSAQIAKSWLLSFMAELSIKPDTFQDLGLAILDAHDDEHGDVKEYNHSVVIERGTDGYRIESSEADQAALQEMEALQQDIGSALGDFFDQTMGIKSPFSILFGSDGLLSLDAGGLPSFEANAVRDVLKNLNSYLAAEEAGEETEGMLSPVLTGIGEKFVALKEIQEKIHDKSLLPKDGWRFAL